jgi:transposase
MPCRILEIKRRTIEVNIALEKPSKEIAKDVNVSRRSVQRFSKNLRVHGSLSPPKVVPQGRPRMITPEMQEVRVKSPLSSSSHANGKSLLDYLAARPSVYIDEQVYYLWDTFGVQVDEQCIKRMLKRVKWSKKKVPCIMLLQHLFHKLSDF